MLALVIAGCHSKTDTPPAERVTQNDAGGEAMDTLSAEAADSILIPRFEVEVKLSDLATERLRAEKETIIVSVYCSGEPRAGADANVNEMGEVSLNTTKIEMTEPGIARFNHVRVSKKDIANLSDPDFLVSVNVFSGRRSTSENLLDCDILEKSISETKGKLHVLNGKLIEE